MKVDESDRADGYVTLMEWNDLPESLLAQDLKARKLAHPTNAGFDAAAWDAALDALTEPTERDVDLAFAAIHYGQELASLRQHAIPLVSEGFNRPRLVRLLAAYANQQYLTLREKMFAKLKSDRRSGVHDFEQAQQQLMTNVGGQEMTADDLLTYLVDSLPHWLFHIWQLADDARADEPEEAIQFGGRASEIVSIEHSLRHLWLCALWNGDGKSPLAWRPTRGS